MAGQPQFPHGPPIGVPPEFDPSAMKLTRGTSCVLCQQRKVRCDKKKPCANCVKARVECRVVPPQPPRRRKKRLQEKDLIERLKKYEALLVENGVAIDPIANSLGGVGSTGGGAVNKVSDPNSFDEVGDLENDFEGLHTSPDGSQASHTKASSHRPDKEPYKWFLFHREFRASEDILRDSSEDEDQVGGSAVHRAFDTMYEQQDGFPFIVGSNRASSVADMHPTTIQIFQLWQVYINNVNPLLKITHTPTIQGLIIEASTNLDNVPKNLEALMFSIYIIALNTMDDAECRKLFDEPKRDLLAHFHRAGQQALINAGFMRTADMMVLQAYIIFLVFCYVGIAVRVGQRLGLHRDGSIFGLSPFEIEQRRRLWWTIVGYDRRIGEMTGSTVTALSTIGDCKLPLNINDNDLHADGTEAPTPQNGPSEMLFPLIRAELAMAISTDSTRDQRADVNKNDPSVHRPLSMVRMAGPGGRVYTLDGFFAHIEGTYLAQCDQKIPLHFFTITMTRQALCKMRVTAFLIRMSNGDPSTALNDREREILFEEAIQMIEYDNVVQSAESLKGFKWYTFLHFPLPAYMFLVTELRHRTQGPIVDRAWDAIAANHELRGLMNTLHNPMHLAFGHFFVKAWDARSAAQRRVGIVQQTPGWIERLRQRAEKKRKRKSEKNPQQAHGDSAAVEPGALQQLPPVPPMAGTMPGVQQQQQQQQGAGVPPSQQGQASSESPGSNSMMVTPPGDPGLEASLSQMMGYNDPSNEFGDVNWGFLMQGYDMNSYAGIPTAYGPYGMPAQQDEAHGNVPPAAQASQQSQPPPGAGGNPFGGS